jgi:erythronate-4-phosphate dehydrogenase
MKILADANMPLAQKLFNQFGEVILKQGRQICAEDLVDIDALMVRSITKVNNELLAKANKLKFVGTATAGFDHIDTSLLAKKNIAFSNAQGCNKISVGEYVLSALLFWQHKYNLDFSKMSIGVIGAGCTGSEVIKRAKALKLDVKICDPLLKDTLDPKYSSYVNLNDALSADIITFHVPLERGGKYPTYHLLNAELLNSFSGEKFIINASRGEVIDDYALTQTLKQHDYLHLIKDVWEGEPNISNPELIKLADIATPHIAGYAYEGKCRGTFMLYEKLCNLFGQTPIAFNSLLKKADVCEITINSSINDDLLRRLVNIVYDVRRDNDIFKRCYSDGTSFDNMRKNYLERRELASLTIHNATIEDQQKLIELGFNISN